MRCPYLPNKLEEVVACRNYETGQGDKEDYLLHRF